MLIDTLDRCLPRATFDRVRARFPVAERGYAVLTLHRPANVDRRETLSGIAEAIRKVGPGAGSSSSGSPRGWRT